jgi:5S rRNA maturation endonuclease (ribonuclease M5)
MTIQMIKKLTQKEINEFIKEYCGSLVWHLLDSDQNSGQRLRDYIEDAIEEAYNLGRESSRKSECKTDKGTIIFTGVATDDIRSGDMCDISMNQTTGELYIFKK